MGGLFLKFAVILGSEIGQEEDEQDGGCYDDEDVEIFAAMARALLAIIIYG